MRFWAIENKVLCLMLHDDPTSKKQKLFIWELPLNLNST